MIINGIGEATYLSPIGTKFHSSFDLNWIDWQPSVIFDVGAFDFGDAVRMKDRWPSCDVHAFEILESNYSKYAQLASDFGVITNRVAISDNCGKTKFWEGRSPGTGCDAQSSLLEPDTQYKDNYSYITHNLSSEEIYCITLEKYCKNKNIEHVDFLHIDTEGGEYLVLKGLGKIRPKMIFAEFLLDGGWKGQASFKDIIKMLESWNYKLFADLPHDKVFIHES